MVLASHVIFTTYGFWLPNDPRGSWSTFVGSWELFKLGQATKVETTRSVAHVPHDRNRRMRAKRVLKCPPVALDGTQARSVALAFADASTQCGYVIHACSILPTHVHAVIAAHARDVEDIVAHLKYAATRRLTIEGSHPMLSHRNDDGTIPSMWTKRSWKVYLDSPEDVLRAINYVEHNPLKDGKRRQRWSFVQPLQMSAVTGSAPHAGRLNGRALNPHSRGSP